jgi:hypothetical protein
VRTEIKTGVRDGKWIEVTHRRVPDSLAASPGAVPRTPIDGTEHVIVSNLSRLTDGAPVRVAPVTAEPKVARASPPPGP